MLALLQVVLLVSTARAEEPWVAVRDDARLCVGRTAGGPCTRLTGTSVAGAHLARVVEDLGDELLVRWDQPPRGACLAGAPGVLPSLGLELRVAEADVLPVLAAPLAWTAQDGGARVELVPGLPLWPGADGRVTAHLQGMVLSVPGAASTLREHRLTPGQRAGASTATTIPAEADPTAVVAATAALPDGPTLDPGVVGARAAGEWDAEAGTLTLSEQCASLRLPWAADALLRPAHDSMGGIVGGVISDTIPEGSSIRLQDGTVVGHATAVVVLSRSSGGATRVLPAAEPRSTVDGATCFAVQTTHDPTVPSDESSLYLCARMESRSRPLPPRNPGPRSLPRR